MSRAIAWNVLSAVTWVSPLVAAILLAPRNIGLTLRCVAVLGVQFRRWMGHSKNWHLILASAGGPGLLGYALTESVLVAVILGMAVTSVAIYDGQRLISQLWSGQFVDSAVT